MDSTFCLKFFTLASSAKLSFKNSENNDSIAVREIWSSNSYPGPAEFENGGSGEQPWGKFNKTSTSAIYKCSHCFRG